MCDITRPISPSDIRDFPFLEVNKTIVEEEDPLQLIVEDEHMDTVARFRCSVRTVSISQDDTHLYRLVFNEEGKLVKAAMADSGANVCMFADADQLTRVHDIPTPIPIGLALKQDGPIVDVSYCRQMGYLPMSKEDGSIHLQPCLIHPSASDNIISPQSIAENCPDVYRWEQHGYTGNHPGFIKFFDKHNDLIMMLNLHKHNKLYYSSIESLTVDSTPIHQSYPVTQKASAEREPSSNSIWEGGKQIYGTERESLLDLLGMDTTTAARLATWDTTWDDYIVNRVDIDNRATPFPTSIGSYHRPTFKPLLESLDESKPFEPFLDPLAERDFDQTASATIYNTTTTPKRTPLTHSPVTLKKQVESEMWAARLGFCSEWQLDVIPSCATGLPNQFEYHPFRFIDHKEQALIRKKAAGRVAKKAKNIGQRFFADFGFLRASTMDFSRRNEEEDRIVQSYDGFNSYLLVVDEHSRHLWVFLSKSKEPPIEEMSDFLSIRGLPSGGVIRCDQGGELAKSTKFRTEMMRRHHYVVEPTGADSPSQNGGVEKWNDTLAVTVRLSYMVQHCQRSIGPQHCYMRYTYTIDEYIE